MMFQLCIEVRLLLDSTRQRPNKFWFPFVGIKREREITLAALSTQVFEERTQPQHTRTKKADIKNKLPLSLSLSESSPSRSRSPSPPSRDAPYRLRSKAENQGASGSRNTRSRQQAGNIRTFADLNRSPADGADIDSDEGQEYYTGGQRSGMMVQDPKKPKDVDALLEQARLSAVDRPVEPSRSASTSFTGASRMLSGEPVPSAPQQQLQEQPQLVMHTIAFWSNGFTVNDGPLRMFEDPENAFMEVMRIYKHVKGIYVKMPEIAPYPFRPKCNLTDLAEKFWCEDELRREGFGLPTRSKPEEEEAIPCAVQKVTFCGQYVGSFPS
ncbi:unnamed protein product [Eruca vesicaria subsp. sativa]|uniref:SEP domain-containing protein n=1 Tax=Eruca vesicaria subsp. sativa TaxID=29727 RepID=A0ABC8LER7_ERUVS|nr:unnamed protein product [Eruca vesicaria subsp. sativa]